MEIFIEIILKAGRSAVELALFVLLPVMVVMLSLMRLLEARGVLDWVVARLAPLLKPFGLTGLGVFAALQINFVSFAAPLATLTMMEQRGASDRHIAATLAMRFSELMGILVFLVGVVALWAAHSPSRRLPLVASVLLTGLIAVAIVRTDLTDPLLVVLRVIVVGGSAAMVATLIAVSARLAREPAKVS